MEADLSTLRGLGRADFTGMLGLSGEEARFVPALAREIERLRWDNFTLADYADPRIGELAAYFQRKGFRTAADEPTPSPYIALPDSWETYVNSRSQATRRTIRAKLRKIESLPGYRFGFATPEEADRAIDALDAGTPLTSGGLAVGIADPEALRAAPKQTVA